MHDGVDLSASRSTVIRAAATGTITLIRCNGNPYLCDRDGSPTVKGCGWYLEITPSALAFGADAGVERGTRVGGGIVDDHRAPSGNRHTSE